MTTMRKGISFALAAVLAVVTLGCGAREEKRVAQADAAEVAQDQEVLDQLRSAGSILAKPHHVEFFLYLPSEADAQGAEAELRSLGYSVTVRGAPNNTTWLCTASRTMIPTIQDLSDARGVFKGLALRHKGAYDGWQAAIEHGR